MTWKPNQAKQLEDLESAPDSDKIRWRGVVAFSFSYCWCANVINRNGHQPLVDYHGWTINPNCSESCAVLRSGRWGMQCLENLKFVPGRGGSSLELIRIPWSSPTKKHHVDSVCLWFMIVVVLVAVVLILLYSFAGFVLVILFVPRLRFFPRCENMPVRAHESQILCITLHYLPCLNLT